MPDLWLLYRQMLRSRRFEQAVMDLWERGWISGEMHLGIGEEAVAAGVVCHIQNGDAMALDHRSTPPLVIRGVDLLLILKELLGHRDGLCSGMGGHMHLFSRHHLAASTGIVGASGPLAAGFALAAWHLRPKKIAVAFFGEGAMNQGMVMESLNLASVWELPLLFVCKDNKWAITTRSRDVTGGVLTERARSFGLPAEEVDGSDVEAVWNAAAEMIGRIREGKGPAFLLARCPRLEGHFMGDPLLRILRKPLSQMKKLSSPVLRSLTARKGVFFGKRLSSFIGILSHLLQLSAEQRNRGDDPVVRVRNKLRTDKARLDRLEEDVSREIKEAVQQAMGPKA